MYKCKIGYNVLENALPTLVECLNSGCLYGELITVSFPSYAKSLSNNDLIRRLTVDIKHAVLRITKIDEDNVEFILLDTYLAHLMKKVKNDSPDSVFYLVPRLIHVDGVDKCITLDIRLSNVDVEEDEVEHGYKFNIIKL
jgi:hypothetical protein